MATAEKFYDILERVHSTENGHVGYKKMLAEVWELCMLLLKCHQVLWSLRLHNIVKMGWSYIYIKATLNLIL